MSRPLPSPEMSVNLLREIADGIERECSGKEAAGVGLAPTDETEPENVARQVAPKIAGHAFKARIAKRRQAPDERARTTDQEHRLHRPRKSPGRR